MPRRALLPAAAGALAVAAFVGLAAAGLPIITRYMLLTGVVLALFAGAGLFGWRDLRPGPHRTWWARFAAVALLAVVVFVPDQARRIDRLSDALAVQAGIQDDLADAVRDGVPCRPVAVPNRRPIPLLALWLDERPEHIADAQAGPPRRGTYLRPATPEVARDYILDRRDRDRRVPPPPPGFARVGATAAWTAYARC
jgi:hypothetical protein